MALTQIKASNITDGTVVAAEIASNAVTTAKINADAIDGTKIADNAIDSEHYTDGSIDAAHLAANSVDSDSYVDASIDEAHIAADAVNFVTHLKAGTDGELITWDASGNPAAVAVGTATHVLTSGGAGVAPTFAAAAAGGAWTLLTNGTQVASGSASLTVTGLDSTYDTYVVVYSDIKPASDAVDIRLRLGDSSGIDSGGSDYAYHNHASAENSSNYSGQSSASYGYLPIGLSLGNAAGEGGGGIAYIHQPGDATTFPIVTWSAGGVKESTIIQMSKGVGIRQAVITVDRVELSMQSGNITSGRMSVYGIAHA